MTKRISLALVAGLIIFFSSCDQNTVYEEKIDFEKGYWLWKDPVEFTFKIDDPSARYDLSYFVRNELDFPYRNIYLQYYLEDSLGNLIEKKLNNVVLFDPKTGRPLGNGFGSTYDNEKVFLDDYKSQKAGTYTLRIDQYMRPDTLLYIKAIGVEVKKDVKKED